MDIYCASEVLVKPFIRANYELFGGADDFNDLEEFVEAHLYDDLFDQWSLHLFKIFANRYTGRFKPGDLYNVECCDLEKRQALKFKNNFELC